MVQACPTGRKETESPKRGFCLQFLFSCIEKGKAVASNLYQLLYYSVPPPSSEIGVVGGFKLSAIKCFELFYKAPIAFSSTNHKREDTRYQFKIKQESPLWTSILGVFHRHGIVCAGQEFVAVIQIILGGTVAQSSHMDFYPRTSKWFPTRQAANAKDGAGPLMG